MPKLRMLALALAALGALATPAARADAHLTLVHGLSGEPLGYDRQLPVDVYVDGVPAAQDLVFAGVVQNLVLPAGERTISVYLAAADPTIEPPLLETVAVLEDHRTAHAVAHADADGAPRLTVFSNNDTPQLPQGPRQRREDRLTLRHVADVGRLAFNNLFGTVDPTAANGDTLSFDLKPRRYSWILTRAGFHEPVIGVWTRLRLRPNRQYYVYVIGSAEDRSLRYRIFTTPFPRP
jgi:hypothetical protein